MSMGLQAQKTQTWRWKRLYLRVFDQESVKDTLLLSTFLMMSNINKILVWNCRGAASSSFYRNCKNCLDIHHPEILAIMETHISPLKLQQSFQLMGFDGFNYSENRGFAGGIIVVWKSNKVDVEEASKHFQYIHLKIKMQNGGYWFFTTVYASPVEDLRTELWDELGRMANIMDDRWLVAGDFNDILGPNEKKGGAVVNRRKCSLFRDRIDACSLIDLGAVGSKYTWRGPIHNKERIFEQFRSRYEQ
ncbi:hypothetical protein L195_g014415 [Trifolium pratense]|uniref:Endonuclease/exonuclease/phosphatase domain-containing protein n=1 Tax=Trifolium pratense TaxID=57577 RepID=A0A2K3PQW6_TRIPR|nr:hypothetical protein L195_g014415 [Trifolium pratense]